MKELFEVGNTVQYDANAIVLKAILISAEPVEGYTRPFFMARVTESSQPDKYTVGKIYGPWAMDGFKRIYTIEDSFTGLFKALDNLDQLEHGTED